MKNTTLGVKSLVRRECANFNYEDSFCFQVDCKCRFYAEQMLDEDGKPIPARCKYFEKGVLPLEPKLECDYRLERRLGIDENVDKCESCGDYIRKASNRQKYCDKCKRIMLRDQKREWAYKSRTLETLKSGKMNYPTCYSKSGLETRINKGFLSV